MILLTAGHPFDLAQTVLGHVLSAALVTVELAVCNRGQFTFYEEGGTETICA